MTIVSLNKKNIKEGYQEFNIKDHAAAERNEMDHDLVCCSCSILLYTLVAALSESDLIINEKEVVNSINNVQNNYPDITIKIKWKRKADEILETILTGYKLLEKNYKKNVKVLTIF